MFCCLQLVVTGGGQVYAQVPAQLQGTWAGTANLFGTPANVLFNFRTLHWSGTVGKAIIFLPSIGLHSVQVDQFVSHSDSLKLLISELPGAHVVLPTADTLGPTGYPLVAGQRLPSRVRLVIPLAWRGCYPLANAPPAQPNRELSTTLAGGAPGVAPAGIITAPLSLSEPGTVFISGSGPHNSNGEELGHKFFLVPADELIRRGMLCYVTASAGRGLHGSTCRVGHRRFCP